MDDRKVRLSDLRVVYDWPNGGRRHEHRERRATLDDLIEVLGADSDALIIRRDENGEWPEWVLDAWAKTGGSAMHYFTMLDALASSQGVEP